MAAITQPNGHVLSGRRYGSFAGKAEDPHPVDILTQPTGYVLSMRRYGSFSGRAESEVITADSTYIPTFRSRRGR